MKKIISKTIRSMVLVVLVMLVSIPFWKFISKTDAVDLSKSFANLPIAINIENFDSVSRIDELNDNFNISLKNRNNIKKTAKLYAVIDKTSEVISDSISLNIDGNNYELSYMESDDDYNYYFIKDIDFNEYEEKSISTKLNILDNELNGSNILMMDFQVRG